MCLPQYVKLPPESQGIGLPVHFTCLLKNAISPIHVNSNQPNCTGALATGQAMLQWKEYQARHWPRVKLCYSGKNTRHVIGHRSSYATVERIPGTSLATGQAMLQWKEYQARHCHRSSYATVKEYQHVIGHRSSYAAVERIPGTSLATGQAMLQWKKYQHVHHRNGALG